MPIASKNWKYYKIGIKRRIPVSKIVGITVSKTSYEFVVHIPEEYDYRYSSIEKRDKILEHIAQAYVQINKEKLLAFYFKVGAFANMNKLILEI